MRGVCVRVYVCGGRERGVRGVCIYVCTCMHVCGV